jgi:hypothetical protein
LPDERGAFPLEDTVIDSVRTPLALLFIGMMLSGALAMGCLFPSFEGMNGGGDADPKPSLPDAGLVTGVVAGADGGNGVVAMTATATPVADVHTPETCNGIDDNGDGKIDESGCTDPVEQLSGHAYMFVKQGKTWASARAHCASFGYKLVTIDGVAENTFISGLAARAKGDPSWWLGLNDRDVEGKFVWDDGAPASFTNWASGQPDNFFDEDCAVILSNTPTGAWDDIGCDSVKSFVCEAGR